MDDKAQILIGLREELERWLGLLAVLSVEQITAPVLPANLSVKDVVAHLMVWQQRSIIRLEAALHGREPEFPGWPAGLDPESDEDVDRVNAWIYETTHPQPWAAVYEGWHAGFLRLLALAESIPDRDLLEPGRFAWLYGLPLSAVLLGSYDHHHEEHLKPLHAWLAGHGTPGTAG